MSIIRVVKDKKNPYLIMNKTGINDKRLSLKAKGLLCYLLSKPDNWFVNTSEITSNSINGIKSVYSAINELVHFGYMLKHQFRKEDGKYDHYNYLIYERPSATPPLKTTILPKVPFRQADYRLAEKDTVLINNDKEVNNKQTTSIPKSTPGRNIIDDTPNQVILKSSVIFLLNKLKIKNQKKLFDLFPLSDIFKYAMWVSTNNFKMSNPTGFLITAIRDNWIEKNLP